MKRVLSVVLLTLACNQGAMADISCKAISATSHRCRFTSAVALGQCVTVIKHFDPTSSAPAVFYVNANASKIVFNTAAPGSHTVYHNYLAPGSSPSACRNGDLNHGAVTFWRQ